MAPYKRGFESGTTQKMKERKTAPPRGGGKSSNPLFLWDPRGQQMRTPTSLLNTRLTSRFGPIQLDLARVFVCLFFNVYNVFSTYDFNLQ